MFGLGMGEIMVILVLALILLGPQKLPDAAKQLGKGLRELRRATDDLKHQFEEEMNAVGEAVKPSAPKPTLVQPPQPASLSAAGALAAPPATAENVPGLEVALAEPPPPPPPPSEGDVARTA